MHKFDTDFYGYELRAIVLGYIRPELDYTSRGRSCILRDEGADVYFRGTDRGHRRRQTRGIELARPCRV